MSWSCLFVCNFQKFLEISFLQQKYVGGVVASWLVRSSPERVVLVRALAGGHCVVFLGKTLNSHSASLHPVYKWVPVNCCILKAILKARKCSFCFRHFLGEQLTVTENTKQQGSILIT